LFEERGMMKFHQAVLNTLIVALLTMFVCLVIGSITGYEIARLRFKWGMFLFFALIGTQMVPPLTDLILLNVIFSRWLKRIDTKATLVIGYTGWLMPLSAPGLAGTAIYVFISSTNKFLFAMIFADTYRAKTIPVALADMVGKYQIRYGDMKAGAVITAIIPVILALIFQKYLVRGLTAGGVKG
jgi:multiple sugar transport system permease protein